MMYPVTSLHVAIVRYENQVEELGRCLASLGRAVELALRETPDLEVTVSVGDCSASPLENDDVGRLLGAKSARVSADYTWFNANLNHSGGCNALVVNSDAQYFLFLNPDTYASPWFLLHLLPAFADPEVAAADARQIPCEHPKYFDPHTGDQSWASGACMMVRGDLFHLIDGFDARYFPSYVNDVDLSWRLRTKGHKIVHRPQAVIFHDKRLDSRGVVAPTATEAFASNLARLILAEKAGRRDVLNETLSALRESSHEVHQRALAEYEQMKKDGDLPEVVPGLQAIADFRDGDYGERRF